MDELVIEQDGKVNKMDPDAELDGGSDRSRSRKSGNGGSDSDDNKKGKKAGRAPWTPKGVVRDVDVLRSFLFALLNTAKKYESPATPHALQSHFTMAMRALVTGLALIGWLVISSALGTFLGFVYLGIVGVVALVYIAKRLQSGDASPRILPHTITASAFQTPGGTMLAAALGRVERERAKGTEWAVEWYRLFHEAFGANVNPAMELLFTFVDESMEAERAKTAVETKTVTKVVEKVSWNWWGIPSVFSFLGLLLKLAAWGVLIYVAGLCFGFWTFKDTLGPYTKHMPYLSAVEKSWEHRDRSTTELFPNGSPQGATGPSDRTHEKLLFSSPYDERSGSK